MSLAFEKPGSREAVLAAMQQSDWKLLPPIASFQPDTPDTIDAFADQTGLASSFVWLAKALFGFDMQFAADVVNAVPQGCDTARVAERWLASVAQILLSECPDPELAATARELLEMHDRAQRGGVLGGGAWRAIRGKFRALGNPKSRSAGRVLAAAAWDPITVPAAFGEVVMTWREYVLECVEAEIGWTPDHASLLLQWRSDSRSFAMEQAGPPDEDFAWRQSEEGKAWEKRYAACAEEYRALHPLAIPDRDELVSNAWNARLVEAQAIFLEHAKG